MTRVQQVSEDFILRFSPFTCFYIHIKVSSNCILSGMMTFWDHGLPYLLIAGFGDVCFGSRPIVSDASPYTYHLAVRMDILSSSSSKLNRCIEGLHFVTDDCSELVHCQHA
jgi:hypothetical protein